MERIKSIPSSQTAILLVDVQNSEIDDKHKENHRWYYQQIKEVCLPNMKRIIEIGRSFGIEIIYTTIESLTSDGRDRSLDHKLSNIFIPKNSYLGKVIDDVAPHHDDIHLKKTSSGVFNSTNLDYILRNLSITHLVVMGMLTDQCVDMAVRDGADKGYNVICISDACTTHSLQRHENALNAFKGYCTIFNTQQFIEFLQKSNENVMKPMSLTTLVTTDLIGITRGRSIRTSDLDKYYQTGCGWVPANCALTPQNHLVKSNPWGSHGDLRLLPDRTSRVRLIHSPDRNLSPLDYIHCDIIETNGNQWDCCPRTLLKNEIEFYKTNFGIELNVAFEHEFTLINEKSNKIHPAFSLNAQREQNQFASWLMSSLQNTNNQPEMFLSEFGQNQYEITCSPSDPLIAADRAVNIKQITREIAQQMNLNVTFCPHPSFDLLSNGLHLHVSMKDNHGKYLFYDKDRPYNLSLIGEYWSAGIIHNLESLCAITAPTPVSYLRLKPNNWSSTYGCLGYRNRETALRICPFVEFGSKSIDEQYNLEYRPMDSTCSPHLSLASLLFAGRYGIENKLKLSTIFDSTRNNDSTFSKQNLKEIPKNLRESLENLRTNQVFLNYFPKTLIEIYLSIKTEEISSTEHLDEKLLCEYYSKIY